MNKFREKFMRFMQGRYGADRLYKFSVYFTGILLIANIFLRSFLLWIILLMLIIWNYFRAFSKNISARQAENRIFIKYADKARSSFRIAKLRFRDRKTHCYRKCPVCKKMLRLPKCKGVHTVNCPQCKNDFSVKI